MNAAGSRLALVVVLCAGIGAPLNQVFAQADTSDLPDAPSETVFHPHHGGDAASDRDVSWRSLPKDFLHDQKKIWLFPVELAKGKHWVPIPSDVFLGAALGYTVTKYAVLQPRRSDN